MCATSGDCGPRERLGGYGRRMKPTVSRLSRRTLLTDFGAAGVGLLVLGACSGSSDSASTTPVPGTNAPTDTTGATDAPTTQADATEPSTTDGAPGTEPDDTVTSSSSTLQFEHVSLGFVSAYILVRGNEAAIVDTGTDGSRDAILEGLDALAVEPSMVRHVVLTHNHGDHAGGVAGLEGDLTNAIVHVGTADIAQVQTSLQLEEVEDGDEIFGMGVIGTPGHTPGSISLFDTETGLLVAGDAINGDGSGGLTGANPDFSRDLDAAAASVAKLADLMPQVAAFGHGGPPVTEDVAAKLAALV